jgi:hypothetical protein
VNFSHFPKFGILGCDRRGSGENGLGAGFDYLAGLNRVKCRVVSGFETGYGGELVGCTGEVGRSGSRPGLGRKGEAGWAERDFDPMKPREIQKGFIIS